MKISNGSIFGILGVVIGIFGVLTPIIWDNIRTTKLDVSTSNFSSLISKESKIEGISVLYNDKKVKALSIGTVTVENVGGEAILNKDVVKPLEVYLTSKGDILDVKIIQKQPADLNATIDILDDKKTLLVNFDLLNPGDLITVQLAITNTAPIFNLSGRITDISEIGFYQINKPVIKKIENSTETQKFLLKMFGKHHWSLTIALFVFTAWAFGSFAGAIELKNLRKNLLNNTYVLPVSINRTQLRKKLKKDLDCLEGGENKKQELFDYVDNLVNKKGFVVHKEKKTLKLIKITAHSSDLIYYYALFSFLVASTLWVYFVYMFYS